MDIGAVLIELKKNALANVDAWQSEINARKQEAIETLKAEGVYVESWFYVQLDEKDYLIAYMRADDIAQAQKIGKDSQFAIDQVHKAFKQNWIKVIPSKLLVDLENIKEK
jgi:3'-phosphoadenosine 5'-phosphosulfate sulfotransferase (PAPS reductase)/FAD synthetase